MGAYFDDLGQALRQGHQGVLRRRLPLPAARRHGVGLPVLQGADGGGAPARRGRRQAAGHLRQGDQHGAQVQAGRHGDHHARVPRQLPLHLDLGGRLRAGGRACCSPASTTTATSWSTTPSAPAASSRCASCPRARSAWWWGSSPPRRASSRRRTTSSAGSTRPRATRRSSSCACRPQCGFASTEEGNVLTEDQQWAKLKMIVDISKEVWKE